MVALNASQRLSLSPSLIAGAIVGLVAAAAAVLLPQWRLEALVLESGLPALLPAAAPPLGGTARLALVAVAAALASGGTFAAAERWAPVRRVAGTVSRRADAHPDAPIREPVKAMRDLGTPFLETGTIAAPAPPERALPRDLDTPLAVFDPAAIPDTPMTPSAPVAPLFRKPEEVAEDEPREEARIEIFEFTPPVRPGFRPAAEPATDTAIAAPATDATIQALLDRLEHGVRRGGGRPALPSGDLDVALATLKHFAAMAR